MFIYLIGSWECQACYTRNNPGIGNCVACQAQGPATSSVTSVSTTNVPLSEMFKPPPGSWSCSACYTRNDASTQYCLACESPSDPNLPPKPKSGSFFASAGKTDNTVPTFSFGIPPSQVSDRISSRIVPKM